MKLSDLLGREVVTSDGTSLGKVHDTLMIQDGPLLAGGTTAAFRLHGLAVGRRAFGAQLGYYQGTVNGPWLLQWIFRHRPTIVPWTAVVSLEGDDRILVDATRLDRPLD